MKCLWFWILKKPIRFKCSENINATALICIHWLPRVHFGSVKGKYGSCLGGMLAFPARSSQGDRGTGCPLSIPCSWPSEAWGFPKACLVGSPLAWLKLIILLQKNSGISKLGFSVTRIKEYPLPGNPSLNIIFYPVLFNIITFLFLQFNDIIELNAWATMADLQRKWLKSRANPVRPVIVYMSQNKWHNSEWLIL